MLLDAGVAEAQRMMDCGLQLFADPRAASAQILTIGQDMSRNQLSAFRLSLFLLVIGTIPAHAQWKSVGAMVAQRPHGSQITFANGNANVVMQVLAPDLLRVRMSVGNVSGPDYSWAVI